MKVSTYCPIFEGFYESIFDLDTENFCEENDCQYDDLEIDYKKYQTDVAKAICQEVGKQMSDFIGTIKFESLESPKQYNFESDSIYVLIGAIKENISNYIYEHKNQFCKYLRDNYTSCDGFISSHSNSFDEWECLTKNFRSFKVHTHYLGSVLQFIAENEEITEEDLYYNVMEQINEYEYIKIKQS
jgi:hypothetical protein